jgi:hypothetical protein
VEDPRSSDVSADRAPLYDPNDPVNCGVESDEMAGYAYAYLRRIVYRDPASGARFVFVTTELSLRPGLIALLYALRWKIERPTTSSKTNYIQQKAWATGATATTQPSASHRPDTQSAHAPAERTRSIRTAGSKGAFPRRGLMR